MDDTKPNNGVEIERRFLILDFDPKILSQGKKQHIIQGYAPSCKVSNHTRVRIINDKYALISSKTGSGIKRIEREEPIPVKTARMLLEEQCPFILEKDRYRFPNSPLVLDIFTDPFSIVLAEVELEHENDPVRLPPEIKRSIEVTEQLSNFQLAVIISSFKDLPRNEFINLIKRKVNTVAITGGPGSGKSTAIAALEKEFSKNIMVVSETATALIQNGHEPPKGPRDPLANVFQKIIYQVQESQELAKRLQAIYKGKDLLIADRGTVDGASYLPNGIADFVNLCHTTVEEEYGRYKSVLYLELPCRETYESLCKNNPARYEANYDAAVERAECTKRVWEKHPGFIVIPDKPKWMEKYLILREHIRKMIA